MQLLYAASNPEVGEASRASRRREMRRSIMKSLESFFADIEKELQTSPDEVNDEACRQAFFEELARCSLPPVEPSDFKELQSELTQSISPGGGKSGIEAKNAKLTRKRHRFSRVRPLHFCAAHKFLCFRNNGDLIATTPNSVLIYDRPPAVCELIYKEPLYSILISGVSMAADLNENRILLLRQGSYMATEERAADELLMAEVATGETQLMANIALPQHTILRHVAGGQLLTSEKASRRDGAECRGMQVNQNEHKVYLLYDYYLLVIDLDMQLEPLVIKLRCPTDEMSPAVALMEFDRAVFVLTADSHLLTSSKVSLFSPNTSSCCLTILHRLDSRLAASEIRSCVVDRHQATAFFSVPRGCKLISLAFPMPFRDSTKSIDFENPVNFPVLQDRLYATANCSNKSAAIPCAMAWDPTTDQLLVLESGTENNGLLVAVDFYLDDDAGGDSNVGTLTELWAAENERQLTSSRSSDPLPIVKTFGAKVVGPLSRFNEATRSKITGSKRINSYR